MSAIVDFLAIITILIFVTISKGDDFCTQNDICDDKERLCINKELSDVEYGIVGHAKSLHCCAANYESIIWYRNGIMYPWGENISNFMLDPESRNQTIIVNKLSSEDVGNYSCIVGNELQHRISRNITLKVYNIAYSGIPFSTYIPPNSYALKAGETVKLYCEAFVGKIDLPDANNEIKWLKLHENGTKSLVPHNEHSYVKKIERDKGLTLGLYLIVQNIQSEDFGEYICSVNNAADQIKDVHTKLTNCEEISEKATDKWWVIPLLEVIFVFLIIVCCYIYYKCYKYDVLLCLKHYKNKVKDDNKEFDILVLHDKHRSSSVDNILIPTLINELNYVVFSQQLEKNSPFSLECQTRIASCKCVLVVLTCTDSQAFQNHQYLLQLGQAASNLRVKVLCLLVQQNFSINGIKNYKFVKTLKTITFIEWPNSKRKWQLLRLHLPLQIKRNVPETVKNESYNVNDKLIVCSV